MLNKVCAGFIVVFWVVMMTTLVRVEFFPEPLPLDRYPTQRVLKKIFANPEPARLKVYYHGTYVGFCRIEIHPQAKTEPTEAVAADAQPDGYEVFSVLQMTLSVFGMPSRLRLQSQSTFTRQLDLSDFQMVTKINGGRVSIAGNDVSKKVKVLIDLGDFHDERVLDFNQIQRAGFTSAFGMPGLASFNLPGDSRSTNPSLAKTATSDPVRAGTVTYIDRLDVAGSALRVFLVYSKVNDQMWTKIWVSEADGEVLKVSTSLGLEMYSDVLR